METVEDIKGNLTTFNQTGQSVADHVNNVFSLSISFKPVELTPPRYYNSFYKKYVKESKRQAIASLDDLAGQLERYNLIAPVFLVSWMDWKQINQTLSKISDRVNKY